MNDFVDMDLGLILELLPDGMVDAIMAPCAIKN